MADGAVSKTVVETREGSTPFILTLYVGML